FHLILLCLYLSSFTHLSTPYFYTLSLHDALPIYLGAGCECRIQHIDVEGDMDLLARQRIRDGFERRVRSRRQLSRTDKGHPVVADVHELFRVVVPPADDHHALRRDPGRVDRPPQRAATSPAAAAREVAQIWMCVHPKDAQARMAAGLSRQGGDGCAVVTSDYGEKGRRRHFSQSVSNVLPLLLDAGSGGDVAEVVH